MKRIKYFVVGLIIGAMTLSASTAFADSVDKLTVFLKNMNYIVNGQQVEIKGNTLEKDGVTYIPLREVATMLGYSVDYDKETFTATFTSNSVKNGNAMSHSTEEGEITSGGGGKLVKGFIDSYLIDGKINFDKVKNDIDNEIIDVNDKDESTGETLFMRAVATNAYYVWHYLYEQGADVDEQDFEGRTALHHAVLNNYGSAVDDLLALFKADSKIEDNYGKKPIDYTEKWTALNTHLSSYDR